MMTMILMALSPRSAGRVCTTEPVVLISLPMTRDFSINNWCSVKDDVSGANDGISLASCSELPMKLMET